MKNLIETTTGPTVLPRTIVKERKFFENNFGKLSAFYESELFNQLGIEHSDDLYTAALIVAVSASPWGAAKEVSEWLGDLWTPADLLQLGMALVIVETSREMVKHNTGVAPDVVCIGDIHLTTNALKDSGIVGAREFMFNWYSE